jgi:hypothetical protein
MFFFINSKKNSVRAENNTRNVLDSINLRNLAENMKGNSMKETKKEILPLEIERNFLLKDFSNRPKNVIFSILSQVK